MPYSYKPSARRISENSIKKYSKQYEFLIYVEAPYRPYPSEVSPP